MKRVLLVMASPRDALERLRAAGGFEVGAVPRLADGLVEAHARRPDAVVLDLTLPGGLDVLRAFQRELPEIPALVSTDAATEPLGAEGLRMGAQDHFVVPRDLDVLPRGVRHAIARFWAFRDLVDGTRRRERNVAVGTLVAGIAHEINNPLTYVQGNLELMQFALEDLARSQGLGPEERASLEEALRLHAPILRGVEQIGKLTHSLRRIARPVAEVRRPTDLNQLVSSVCDVLRAQHPGLEVVERLAPAPPVLADEAELVQVLLNLLLNAAQAMEGQGRVEVSTAADNGRVLVQVRDHGEGIPPEVATQLFTPFFTTRPDQTGLGLSVSQRIVEDHGGKIRFSPHPDGGTTFVVELPHA